MEVVGRHEEFFDEDIKYASIKNIINTYLNVLKILQAMIKIEKGKMKKRCEGGLCETSPHPRQHLARRSMPPPRPAPPRLSNPTEISCEADWDAVAGAAGYVLLVKSVADEEGAPWARHVQEGAATTHAEVEGLEPTNTYIVRLVAIDADGEESEMSDEAFIDTLVAGCSGSKGEGKEKKGCCTIA